ncbi:hypothetical protein ABE218_14430 [Bacillus smithii]|mgnify:FL=1|jgi:hypothetical protein|uniref:hypothetical protein n=1 Tax=Bacillus smithii TaxID=1479 RepID=UPI003D25A27D
MVSTFLFFISIIFNVITLFAVVLLYMRQNRLFGLKEEQEKMIQDTEEMLSTYLLQMKDENEAFLKKISSMDAEQPHLKHKKESFEIQSKQDERKWTQSKQPIVSKKEALKKYQQEPSVVGPKESKTEMDILDWTEDDLYENVLFLQKKGLTIEEIAHKLNKGTTEIQLLLKFRANGQ